MREGWTYKKLGEVCKIVGGSTPKTNIAEYWEGDNMWVTPAELIGEKYFHHTERTISDAAVKSAHLQLLPVGTVLLSSRAPIGKVAITTSPMYCNQGFKNAICSDAVKNDYVYWYLLYSKESLQALGTGATFKEISKKTVSEFSIPIPPLATQQQIVSELDLLSHILDQKRQQLKEYDALAESIFYDMFGDPNNSSFELTTISELSREKLTYGSTASAIPYDGEIRYLRITDILPDGSLSPEIMSPNVYDEKYILEVGDILFARSGATVGKTYCYKETDGKGIYAGYLIRMKPNKDKVLPLYIYYFTRTAYYKAFIEANSNAVAQPNVNAKQYGGLRLPLPPLTLQRSFASKIESIEHQKQLLRASIKETEMLFQSRMDYWFNS